MLTPVTVHPKHIESYREAVREGVIEQIREAALPLVGARVLHVNATAYGGGVAEILASMVPLMRDLGIQAERPGTMTTVPSSIRMSLKRTS